MGQSTQGWIKFILWKTALKFTYSTVEYFVSHEVTCKRSPATLSSEAVVQKCSVNKIFLEISQNSQENTCNRVSFLIKLQASGTGVFF